MAGSAVIVSGLAPVDWPAAPEPAAAASQETAPLVAPDTVSARQIARLKGEPVEVLGDRAENSSTWALPDGGLRRGTAAGPVWVRRGGDGSKVDDWAAVDLTLKAGTDGVVRPVAHPAQVSISGGRSGGDTPLATVGRQGRAVSFAWSGSLAPACSGGSASHIS